MDVERIPARKNLPVSSKERITDHPLSNFSLSNLGLPITKYYDKMMVLTDKYGTNVLVAGTGCGKTIGLPLMLLKHYPDARIVITQPRNAPMDRISSHAAKLVGDKVGGLIGVRYKGSGQKWSEKTRIMYEMEQTLQNELDEDSLLLKYNVAVIDEYHEAGGRTQDLMDRLQDAQAARKDRGLEELKIIAASATIDTDGLRQQLGDSQKRKRPSDAGKEVTELIGVIEIEVIEIEDDKSHDVIKKYIKPNYLPMEMPAEAAKMAKSIIDAGKNPGDILIFLAGVPEIRNTKQTLESLGITEETYDIHILSSGTTEEQKEAIASKAPGGKRKIILSTNSGETGMTFHKDLYYMIDSGLIKQTRVDPDTGMEYLATDEHSWSGCMQRDGRLGRVGPGEAIHLYSEDNFALRERVKKYPMPEIQRSNLIPYMLELLRRGKTDVRHFRFLDQPDQHIIDLAMDSLVKLGAIDEREHLTSIGREMAVMSTDPHLARMMIEGKRLKCSQTIETLTALIESAPSLIRDHRKTVALKIPGSDFLSLLNIYREYLKQPDQKSWADEFGVDGDILEKIAGRKKEFKDVAIDSEAQKDLIGRCIAAGYKDQVLEVSGDNLYRFLANPSTRAVQIDHNSQAQNSGYKYLCAAGIKKGMEGQTLAQLCHAIKKEWIEDILEKAPEPLTPQPVTIRKPDEKQKDVTVQTSAGEPRPRPVTRAPKTEKLSLLQRIKSTFNRFVNFIKNLLRRPHPKTA